MQDESLCSCAEGRAGCVFLTDAVVLPEIKLLGLRVGRRIGMGFATPTPNVAARGSTTDLVPNDPPRLLKGLERR